MSLSLIVNAERSREQEQNCLSFLLINMITDASDVCMAYAQARKKREEEVQKIRLEEQQRKQQVIQQSLLC